MSTYLDFYETLRSKVILSNIIKQKVNLKKQSGLYTGLCPFHVEKTPSFKVNDSRRAYHCFGCGAHGDVIKFTSLTHSLSYKDAAIKLAKEFAIDIPQFGQKQKEAYQESDKILTILQLACEFFQSNIDQNIIQYLESRNINKQTIKAFRIGFAPARGKLLAFFHNRSITNEDLIKAGLLGQKDNGSVYDIFYNRVMFPITNVYDKVIGFGGRVICNALPKYINSPETIVFQKSNELYNQNKAMSDVYKTGYFILVEGYLDAIALCQAGFKSVLASLGTAVTTKHINKLWQISDEIIVCLDGDEAGIRATNKLINLVLPIICADKKISFILLPDKHDPHDIVIRKDGNDLFQRLLNNRLYLSELIWKIEYDGKNFSSPESISNLEFRLKQYSKQIKDFTLSKNYLKFFKDQIWNYCIKYKKSNVKNNKLSNTILNLDTKIPLPNYSEIEIIEHAFCALLIKHPGLILTTEERKEFILSFNFQNKLLSDFRDWFFEIFDNEYQVEEKNIEKLVKNTRFYDTFSLLSEQNNPFLGILYGMTIVNHALFWKILYKKYHLVLLKQEYMSVISNNKHDLLIKISSYKQEILKISEELNELNEDFYNAEFR